MQRHLLSIAIGLIPAARLKSSWFCLQKVLITALEDNAFTENSLAQETWDSLAGTTFHTASEVTLLH